MSKTTNKFSAELREHAVRMVFDMEGPDRGGHRRGSLGIVANRGRDGQPVALCGRAVLKWRRRSSTTIRTLGHLLRAS